MYRLILWLVIIGSAHASELALSSPSTISQQVQSLRGSSFQTMMNILDNIDATDELGRSFLHYATIFGNVQLVKFLLKYQNNTDFKDKDGKTPFDHALQRAQDDNNLQQMLIVSHLLEHRNGINTEDERGWTPLLWAMLSGNITRIEELLKGDAEMVNGTIDIAITLQDERIWQLFWQYRRREITNGLNYYIGQIHSQRTSTERKKDIGTFVEFMLTLGDDEWIKSLLTNSRKSSVSAYALDMVLFSQDQHIWQIFCDLVQHNDLVNLNIGQQLRLLIENKFWHTKTRRQTRDDFIKFVITNRDEITASDKQMLLLQAIISRRTSLVQFLIDSGADIEASYDAEKLLPVAAKIGARNLVEILFANNIDVEQTGKDGRTALAIASYFGHDNIVSLLLDKKANIDALDKQKKTAFMLAAYRGRVSTVKLLYDRGATIDSESGSKALAFAALGGHYTMVELLLEYGLNITDKTLDYARLSGNQQLVQLLENHVTPPSQ